MRWSGMSVSSSKYWSLCTALKHTGLAMLSLKHPAKPHKLSLACFARFIVEAGSFLLCMSDLSWGVHPQMKTRAYLQDAGDLDVTSDFERAFARSALRYPLPGAPDAPAETPPCSRGSRIAVGVRFGIHQCGPQRLKICEGGTGDSNLNVTSSNKEVR